MRAKKTMKRPELVEHTTYREKMETTSHEVTVEIHTECPGEEPEMVVLRQPHASLWLDGMESIDLGQHLIAAGEELLGGGRP